MAIIRKDTRHLTDTVGGLTGIVDLNPRNNNGNFFINIPLVNMFEEFFNFNMLFDYNQRNQEPTSYFGIGMRFGLNVTVIRSLEGEKPQITVINFLNEERVFVKEKEGEVNTFYHSDSMSRVVNSASQCLVYESDGSIFTYNISGNNGNLIRVRGSNNVTYTVTEDRNSATVPLEIVSVHGTIRFRRTAITQPVTCIDFRFDNTNTDVTRNFQIHLTYISRRLTQIKYYNRGKYIQKTFINYDAESIAPNTASLKNFRSLEIVDHNTKERINYVFSGFMVREVIKGIDEDYKYQSNLDISYQGNTVTVINERKQKMICGFRNDGSLEFESDDKGNASYFRFNADQELILQSPTILTGQINNNAYDLHNIKNFGGAASLISVLTPIGNQLAVQTSTLTNTIRQRYSMNGSTIKPVTLAIWGRRTKGVIGTQSAMITLQLLNNGVVRNQSTIRFSENEWTFKASQIIPDRTYTDFELSVNNNNSTGYELIIMTTKEPVAFFERDPRAEMANYSMRRELMKRNGEFYDIEVNDFNRIESANSIHGGKISFDYDNFNNVTRERRELSNGQIFERGANFTNNGRRIGSETTFSGATTNYRYANNGEDLVEISNPDESATDFGLDSNFRIISMTQRGHLVQNSHFFKYNDNDNIENVRAGDSKKYQYLYGDSLEFEGVKTINPLNNKDNLFTTFSYDDNGNVKMKKYGTKDSFQFGYDFDGRIRKIYYNKEESLNVLARYNYDDSNLRMSVKDCHRDQNIQFDFNGNPITLTTVELNPSLNVNEESKIETIYENVNFVGRAYTVSNEKRYVMKDGYTENMPEQAAITSHLWQANRIAFCDFQMDKFLVFRDVNNKHEPLLPASGGDLRLCQTNLFNYVQTTITTGLKFESDILISHHRVSFWFRTISNRRQVLFMAGRAGSGHQIEVFMEERHIRLRVINSNQQQQEMVSIERDEFSDNSWMHLGIAFGTIDGGGVEYRLFLNGRTVATVSNFIILGSVTHDFSFGQNVLGGNNTAQIDIAYIVTGNQRADEIRNIYNMTRSLFRPESGLRNGISGITTASHFLERSSSLEQFNLFPLNGTLKSIDGIEPTNVSEHSNSFIFDIELGRRVYQAFGSDLRYSFPVVSQTQGTIGLKFKVQEYSGRQTILSALAGNQIIELYLSESAINANRDIILRINSNERATTLSINRNDRRWHTLTLSWHRSVTNMFSIHLNNQSASVNAHDLPFNAFSSLTLEVGNNILATGDINNTLPLMGRVSSLLFGNNALGIIDILKETVKKTEVDSAGLPQRETVGENGAGTITKNFTYATRNGSDTLLSGLIKNETINFAGRNININYEQYDMLGNVQEISGHIKKSYRYDYRNFLISEQDGNLLTEYQYDNNGNILSSNNNISHTVFSYENEENKDLLTRVLNSDKRIDITYDDEYLAIPKRRVSTNLYSNQAVSDISYEFQGRRLTNYRDSIQKVDLEFNYDAQSRRIGKKSVDNGVSNEVKYYYDGDNLITELRNNYRLDFHYDAQGLLFAFTHSVGASSNKYYYLRDALLNIIGITDNQGNIVCEYSYNSWGIHRVLNADGSINNDKTSVAHLNPYRYKGYYWDEQTGLYYLQSRFYDPEIMRFISADDIRFINASSIGGLNLFAYCLNNPISFIDSNGNEPVAIISIIVGFAKDILVGIGSAALSASSRGLAGLSHIPMHILFPDGRAILNPSFLKTMNRATNFQYGGTIVGTVGRVAKIGGYALLALDVGLSIHRNFTNPNLTLDRQITDSIVDVGFSVGGFGLAMGGGKLAAFAVGAVWGAKFGSVVPIAGTLVGAVIGAGIGLGIYFFQQSEIYDRLKVGVNNFFTQTIPNLWR